MAGGIDRATGLPSTRRQARFSVASTGEFPKLAHVSTRGEHSSALAVEDDSSTSMEDFVEVGHKLADAARTIIMKYYRSGFQIIDKEDLSECSFLFVCREVLVGLSASNAKVRRGSDLSPFYAFDIEPLGLLTLIVMVRDIAMVLLLL